MAKDPATPRIAATVILLRRGGKHEDRELEVLMVRRGQGAGFMPGVWVFPGGVVDAEDGEGEEGLRACAARELAEEAGLEVDPAELRPWSQWITPEFVESARFDTHFFVGFAPAHSPPKPDGVEVTEAMFVEPGTALARHGEGLMQVVFPTLKHLQELDTFANAKEVMEATEGREITPVLPKVIGEGTERRVVLPGDPDYP